MDPPGSAHSRQGTPTVDPTPAEAAGIARTKRLHRFDRPMPDEDRSKSGQKKRQNVTASQLPDAKIYPWYVEKHQLNEFSRAAALQDCVITDLAANQIELGNEHAPAPFWSSRSKYWRARIGEGPSCRAPRATY